MGVWNAHTSAENICGSLMEISVLQYGWGWSFVLPGAVMASGGVLVFLFFVVAPEDVGILPLSSNDLEEGFQKQETLKQQQKEEDTQDLQVSLLKSVGDSSSNHSSEAIGFLEAWRIPGVAPFALFCFFSKLVAYTFLYWLPFYISHTENQTNVAS